MSKACLRFGRFVHTWGGICTCKSLYRRVLLMSKNTAVGCPKTDHLRDLTKKVAGAFGSLETLSTFVV